MSRPLAAMWVALALLAIVVVIAAGCQAPLPGYGVPR